MLQASTALQTAAEWLIDAKTIYLYGVGASGVEASGFLHKMIAIDKPCKYYSDPYLSRLSSRTFLLQMLPSAFHIQAETKQCLQQSRRPRRRAPRPSV